MGSGDPIAIAQAAGVVLRLAPEVEVLKPAELRRAVLERARGGGRDVLT